MEINKLVGDEFSKNFFLEHFAYGARMSRCESQACRCCQRSMAVARLRSLRAVLDAQPGADVGTYQLRMAEGNATDLLSESVLKPLNAKLGQNCLSLAGATGNAVQVALPAPAMPMPPRVVGPPASSGFARGSGRTRQAGSTAHDLKPVRGWGCSVLHRELQHRLRRSPPIGPGPGGLAAQHQFPRGAG